MKDLKEIKCAICGNTFKPRSPKQKWCGISKKTRCSYIGYRERERKRKRVRIKNTPEYREKRKLWRKLHPEEREKQRQKMRKRRLKLRFEILKRDNFTCYYCGRKPPECILEIDHKYPKSKGGLDKIENYITSCRECNLGKGDIILEEFNK